MNSFVKYISGILIFLVIGVLIIGSDVSLATGLTIIIISALIIGSVSIRNVMKGYDASYGDNLPNIRHKSVPFINAGTDSAKGLDFAKKESIKQFPESYNDIYY